MYCMDSIAFIVVVLFWCFFNKSPLLLPLALPEGAGKRKE